MNNVWLAGPEAIQTRFLNIAVTQILRHEATVEYIIHLGIPQLWCHRNVT